MYIPEWIPGGWWYAYDRLIVVVRYDVRDTLIRYNPIFNVVAAICREAPAPRAARHGKNQGFALFTCVCTCF